MKIKELIEQLSKVNPEYTLNLRLVYSDEHSATYHFDCVEDSLQEIKFKVNTFGLGER